MSSSGCRTFHLSGAVWILLTGVLASAMGCSGAGGDTTEPAGATSVGRLIDGRDAQGHQYREVPEDGAPEIGIVVRPAAAATGAGWDLRLTVRHFRFSPAGAAGAPAGPAAGRGAAELSLDGRPLAVLHGPGYHLPARLVSRGTHRLTACLYADDSTVWAVHGKPIQISAELTSSGEAGGRGAAGGAR